MSTAESEGKASANGDNAPMPHETAGGKVDPGLKFLKEIILTPEEEREYTRIGKEGIPALIACEAGSKDDGWKSVATMFGVHVWSKAQPEEAKSSLVVCRGQVPLVAGATLDLVQEQFIKAYNNTFALAQEMRASDPMSKETKILYQMPCPEDEYTRIVWGSFAAVGVAWARDFCFLQHACSLRDPKTGERLFCVVANTIERPEVPDMEKLCKRIRSTVKDSGYVFREAADGSVRVTYVVDVNPNGLIPAKIVNTIGISQAMNVSRVNSCMGTTVEALKGLEMEAPIHSTDIGWRGTHEIPVQRPAAGAAPSTVSVKFWANAKIYFRVKGGSDGVASDWKPAEMASKLDAGGWLTYASQTAGSVAFTIQPEVAAGGGGETNGGAAEVSTVDVGLQDAGACVLEWKAAAWFKGLTVFHEVVIS